jgi:hypothetical protein
MPDRRCIMAYVRKTDTLCYDIRENIRDMKSKALSAYPQMAIEVDTPEFDAAVDSVQNSIYSECPDLKGKLPDTWLKKHDRLELRFLKDDGEDNFTAMLRCNNRDGIKLPAHVDQNYYGATVELRPSQCTDALRTWLDEANHVHSKRFQIAEQYDNVEEQLGKYMRQHASLNAAVKEMPEMEMYVPEKYVSKMREATPPRKKKGSNGEPTASEELGIDRNALATMAIAHRLTQ